MMAVSGSGHPQVFQYRSVGPVMSAVSDYSSVHPSFHQQNPQIFHRGLSEADRVNQAKELELKIIKQSLKRTKLDQIEEINQSYKWEMDAMRQELTADAEGNIAQEIHQLSKGKELRLLQ